MICFVQCYDCNKKIIYKKCKKQTQNIKYLCKICCDKKYKKINDVINSDLFSYGGELFVYKEDYGKIEKEERKKILNIKLNEMKLSNFKDNMCDRYVNFGDPDLDTVVQTLYEKQIKRNDRLFSLINKLRDMQLDYDSKIPAYKKYIKRGGDLDTTIENGEIEKLLINDTNYLEILDITDSDTAKNILLGKIKKSNSFSNDYIKRKNTLSFE